MTGATVNSERPSNPIAAALYGALAALILAYGFSYFLTRLGAGMLGNTGAHPPHGPQTLARAGLNLCAMMRASLVGGGEFPGAVAGVERVYATIVLPLSIWAVVPAAAILIGGYAAAKRRTAARRSGAMFSAIASGVVFAGVLALLAPLFSAGVASSALPPFGDIEFNPPDIAFAPHPASTLAVGVVFGVLFAYLGALLALGREPARRRSPDRWWAAGSSAIGFAVLFQILVAAALAIWFISSARSEDVGPEAASRFTQMLPTAAGMVYCLVNGATLEAAVESSSPGFESVYRPLSFEVNLYRGTTRNDDREQTHRPMTRYAYLLTAIGALCVATASWTAVRRGSRDGALPTALRILIVHSGYVALLMWLCRIAWSSAVEADEMVGKSLVFVSPRFDGLALAAAGGVFIVAFLGAYIANRRYSAARDFAPQ